jgi:hypothetical protein
MSWVTHEVKKSAQNENVNQTPVMRTTGVFPIAQLIGGQGVAKGLGGIAPDPLAPLPQVGQTTTFNQEGQTVSGTQVNAGGDVNVGQIGDSINAGGNVYQGNVDHSSSTVNTSNVNTSTVNTGGGAYVGGNQTVQGDMVQGDKVGGDKVDGDKISVGNISGSSGIAIGRGASASVTTQQSNSAELAQLFAPLQVQVAQQNPALMGKVNDLKVQVQAGANADDNAIAGLVDDIGKGAPGSASQLKALFQNPAISAAAGPTTQFILSRLG